jgi:hypothetical protein
MSDITVIENFFPKLQQRLIEKASLGPDIAWFYKQQPEFDDPVLAYDFRKNDENIIHLKSGGFRHRIIQNTDIVSPFYEKYLYNLKFLIEKKFKVEVESFERMHLNLLTPTGIKTKKYGLPHIDMPGPNGKILIYYINDSDGDTVIFDELHDSNDENNSEKKTIIQRVTPKKSRAIMFDSNRYHSGSWPSENDRRIINLNFRVKV